MHIHSNERQQFFAKNIEKNIISVCSDRKDHNFITYPLCYIAVFDSMVSELLLLKVASVTQMLGLAMMMALMIICKDFRSVL